VITFPHNAKTPGGEFYANSVKQSLPKSAASPAIQQKLWDTSEKLLAPWKENGPTGIIEITTIDGIATNGKKKVRRSSTQSRVTRKTSFFSVRDDSMYGSVRSINELDMMTADMQSIPGESESVVSFPTSDDGNESGDGNSKVIIISEVSTTTIQVQNGDKEAKGYVTNSSSRSSSMDTVYASDEMPKISVP